eukprot:scaffold167439_cov20-Tisochrysis_lutea.AAC.1
MLLSTVGIPATADLVRVHAAPCLLLEQGNTGHDANIAFLDYLASTVLMQRQVEQSATDPQQPATSLGAEAKTLEFACDKFLAITSEAAPLFPSDITKMLQQYRLETDFQAPTLKHPQTPGCISTHLIGHGSNLAVLCFSLFRSSDADGMLAHCHQHTQVLAQSAERLQQEIDALAQEVAPCTPEEWARLCSDIQHALDAFLNDIHLFLDTYDKASRVCGALIRAKSGWCASAAHPLSMLCPSPRCRISRLTAQQVSSESQAIELSSVLFHTWLKELHVWCEHLEPPVTHGFGQQAAAMLEAYHKLWRVLDSMASIKQIHSAMTSSQPPLQMRQPPNTSMWCTGAASFSQLENFLAPCTDVPPGGAAAGGQGRAAGDSKADAGGGGAHTSCAAAKKSAGQSKALGCTSLLTAKQSLFVGVLAGSAGDRIVPTCNFQLASNPCMSKLAYQEDFPSPCTQPNLGIYSASALGILCSLLKWGVLPLPVAGFDLVPHN